MRDSTAAQGLKAEMRRGVATLNRGQNSSCASMTTVVIKTTEVVHAREAGHEI
jgi:hypothetical protein